jgi:DNA (cytosine-5)-methyltransferase 1
MTKQSSRVPLTAVDIFSGCGGLTVGLKRAGFKVIGAVEIEPNAFATYKANHPDVHCFKQDARTIKGDDLRKLSPNGSVDLVAGCPPCQGFSSLTAKYRREDPRNYLVREMSRLIKETRPKAVMIENVPGLAQKGRWLLNELIEELNGLGYETSWDILQAADFGVPQNRRRLVVFAGMNLKIPMPKPTHSRNGKDGLIPWRTIQEVIGNMPTPITLDEAEKNGGPQRYNWHVTRTMSLENRKRLKHTKPGKSRSQLPERLRPECHKGLDEGFASVYGRMSWDQPSVTITGGCTTLSKGRFGHPEEDRTISVREAALVQTFPQDYLFDTPFMGYVCDMIGNALPCDFAEVLAQQVYGALLNHHGSMAQNN